MGSLFLKGPLEESHTGRLVKTLSSLVSVHLQEAAVSRALPFARRV
jgi:hypothetical protein